jgi:hypothetical protein
LENGGAVTNSHDQGCIHQRGVKIQMGICGGDIEFVQASEIFSGTAQQGVASENIDVCLDGFAAFWFLTAFVDVVKEAIAMLSDGLRGLARQV